jgi:hypothetical protein
MLQIVCSVLESWCKAYGVFYNHKPLAVTFIMNTLKSSRFVGFFKISDHDLQHVL